MNPIKGPLLTATVLGIIALLMLGFLMWFYRQLRRASRLMNEVTSAQQQRIREVNRAVQLLSRLSSMEAGSFSGELIGRVTGQTNMTEELINEIRNHLEAANCTVDDEFEGLSTDIDDTLGRVHAMRKIEAIWRGRLKSHSGRPAMRFVFKRNGFET